MSKGTLWLPLLWLFYNILGIGAQYKRIYVKSGNSHNFTCLLDDISTIQSLKWLFNNTRKIAYVTNLSDVILGPKYRLRATIFDNKNLILQNLTSNDTGLYKCIIDRNNNRLVQGIYLIVQDDIEFEKLTVVLLKKAKYPTFKIKWKNYNSRSHNSTFTYDTEYREGLNTSWKKFDNNLTINLTNNSIEGIQEFKNMKTNTEYTLRIIASDMYGSLIYSKASDSVILIGDDKKNKVTIKTNTSKNRTNMSATNKILNNRHPFSLFKFSHSLKGQYININWFSTHGVNNGGNLVGYLIIVERSKFDESHESLINDTEIFQLGSDDNIKATPNHVIARHDGDNNYRIDLNKFFEDSSIAIDNVSVKTAVVRLLILSNTGKKDIINDNIIHGINDRDNILNENINDEIWNVTLKNIDPLTKYKFSIYSLDKNEKYDGIQSFVERTDVKAPSPPSIIGLHFLENSTTQYFSANESHFVFVNYNNDSRQQNISGHNLKSISAILTWKPIADDKNDRSYDHIIPEDYIIEVYSKTKSRDKVSKYSLSSIFKYSSRKENLKDIQKLIINDLVPGTPYYIRLAGLIHSKLVENKVIVGKFSQLKRFHMLDENKLNLFRGNRLLFDLQRVGFISHNASFVPADKANSNISYHMVDDQLGIITGISLSVVFGIFAFFMLFTWRRYHNKQKYSFLPSPPPVPKETEETMANSTFATKKDPERSGIKIPNFHAKKPKDTIVMLGNMIEGIGDASKMTLKLFHNKTKLDYDKKVQKDDMIINNSNLSNGPLTTNESKIPQNPLKIFPNFRNNNNNQTPIFWRQIWTKWRRPRDRRHQFLCRIHATLSRQQVPCKDEGNGCEEAERDVTPKNIANEWINAIENSNYKERCTDIVVERFGHYVRLMHTNSDQGFCDQFLSIVSKSRSTASNFNLNNGINNANREISAKNKTKNRYANIFAYPHTRVSLISAALSSPPRENGDLYGIINPMLKFSHGDNGKELGLEVEETIIDNGFGDKVNINNFKDKLNCNDEIGSEKRGIAVEDDYINANFIEGFNGHERSYIATQGPLTNTISDFWRMVWLYRIDSIVMITNLVERGKVKCDKYWPNEDVENVVDVYGDISVKHLGTQKRAFYTVRTFEIKNIGSRKQNSSNIPDDNSDSKSNKDLPNNNENLYDLTFNAGKITLSGVPKTKKWRRRVSDDIFPLLSTKNLDDISNDTNASNDVKLDKNFSKEEEVSTKYLHFEEDGNKKCLLRNSSPLQIHVDESNNSNGQQGIAKLGDDTNFVKNKELSGKFDINNSKNANSNILRENHLAPRAFFDKNSARDSTASFVISSSNSFNLPYPQGDTTNLKSLAESIQGNDPNDGRIIVKQYHYTEWPDHGVPRFTLPLLNFIRLCGHSNTDENSNLNGSNIEMDSRIKDKVEISKSNLKDDVLTLKAKPPKTILVHCSAGVGRTGTFFVIDAMLQKMRQSNCLDIYNYLSRIRTQRNHLVQTEEQFIFIHDALNTAIKLGDTATSFKAIENLVNAYFASNGSAKNFYSAQYSQQKSEGKLDKMLDLFSEPDDDKNLCQRLVDQAACLIESNREFDLMSVKNSDESFKNNQTFVSGLNTFNLRKNRAYLNILQRDKGDDMNNTVILPDDIWRVYLTPKPTLQGSDYINASYLEGYFSQKDFVITQHPTLDTIQSFWRMIWENNVAHIFLLISPNEEHPTQVHQENDYNTSSTAHDMYLPFWPAVENYLSFEGIKVFCLDSISRSSNNNNSIADKCNKADDLFSIVNFSLESDDEDYQLLTKMYICNSCHLPSWFTKNLSSSKQHLSNGYIFSLADNENRNFYKLVSTLAKELSHNNRITFDKSQTNVIKNQYEDGSVPAPIVMIDRYGGLEAAILCLLASTYLEYLKGDGKFDLFQLTYNYNIKRINLFTSTDDLFKLYWGMHQILQMHNSNSRYI
ncbi:unnamed protein product [Gordionus sp. m RMFG-2023]|uniref:uncharacterized protein LOC135931027 n=1 Tax=Gordionus sp. m RMFG-2023 TaxID=3053472 RepID=UPI0030E296A9